MSSVKPELVTATSRYRVSVVIPVFNEQALIERSIRRILGYLAARTAEFDADIIVVNDGSVDGTGAVLARLQRELPQLRVVEHPANRGLGAALKTGFAHVTGDYVITLDADLSYDVEHIGRLLAELRTSHADLVLASPYMSGGSVKNVPAMRLLMSRWANFLLAKLSQGNLTTYTCLVRGYRREFLRGLVLRATDMDIMPETIYKTQVLKGAIEEIPAALDWEVQNAHRSERKSSMRVYSHILGTALTGFMIRPFMFLLLPGLLFGLLAAYCGLWMVIHIVEAYPRIGASENVTVAVGIAFAQFPHTFVIGLLSLIVTIQLLGLALLALQSKKYFEHLFYLASQPRAPASSVRHAGSDPS